MKKTLLLLLSICVLFTSCKDNLAGETKKLNENSTLASLKGPQCFLATVMGETTQYMIVEPAEDEKEKNLSDKIKIEYEEDHIDYLYGEGRKVVIYYRGEDIQYSSKKQYVIMTDDISTEGFREWELFVVYDKTKTKKQIIEKEPNNENNDGWNKEYNLYYYGLWDVLVDVDGNKLPLEEAIAKGKITMSAILAKANGDVEAGLIEDIFYKDGGSRIYRYPEYTIVKYHTIDGNDDMYIGICDMDIKIANM